MNFHYIAQLMQICGGKGRGSNEIAYIMPITFQFLKTGHLVKPVC